MKKANVVNLNLIKTKQQPVQPVSGGQSPVASFAHQHRMLSDCYAVIKQLRQQRQKVKTVAKQKGDLIVEVSFADRHAETVEIVLKKFVNCALDERQVHTAASKTKFVADKSKNYLFLLRKGNKQQKKISMGEGSEFQSIFKQSTSQKSQLDKHASRINVLEMQIIIFQEILKEKNQLITKLMGREDRLKKFFEGRLSQVVRHRNIFNINSNYQQQLKENHGRNLLQVTAGGVGNSTQSGHPKKVEKWVKSPESMMGNRTEIGSISKSSMNKFRHTQNLRYSGRGNTMNSSKLHMPKKSSFQISIANIEPNSIYHQDKVKLNCNLQNLLKRKDQALEQMSENQRKMEALINQLQKEIMAKRMELEQTQSKVGWVKQIDNEQFEHLELNDYYNGNEQPYQTFLQI